MANLLWPGGNAVTRTLHYLGWPVVTLGLGLWLAVLMATREQMEDAVSSWVQKGLHIGYHPGGDRPGRRIECDNQGYPDR